MKLILVVVVVMLTLAGCSQLTPQQVQTVQSVKQAQKELATDLHTIAETYPVGAVHDNAVAAEKAVNSATLVLAPAVEASKAPSATPLDVFFGVLNGSTPILPPQVAPWVGLAGLVYGLIRDKQKRSTDTAAQSAVSALSAGIASKQIMVSSGATKTVDDVVTDHPITDKLVNLIAASGGGDLKTT